MKNVLKILNLINSTLSKKRKQEIIEKNKNDKLFKKVIFYALDYNKIFNITNIKQNINKININNETNKYDTLFNFLDTLSLKHGATNDEKKYLSQIASSYDDSDETIEIVNRIISKNLKCGASVKLFLKIFHDLPFFELMTCSSDINKFAKRYKKQKESLVFWSIKKDGLRCFAINNDNKCKYLSRAGLEYKNFDNLNIDIIKLTNILKNEYKLDISTPIDGEVITLNSDYYGTMQHARTDENNNLFILNVFDIANLYLPFYKRYEILNEIFKKNNFKYLKLLEHHKIVTNEIDIDLMTQIMNQIVNTYNEEGIVVKMGNSPYELKEHSLYWCKMKPKETFDLLVVDKFYGKKGTKYENLLGGLIVKYNDKLVKVGSGFSDLERELFLYNTPKIIEVDCKDITPYGSLREPTFVRVRDDKSTTSDD